MAKFTPKNRGDIIRCQRESLQLTREELATKTELHVATIKRLEEGLTPSPTDQTLRAIAVHLNLPLSLLRTGRDSTPPQAPVEKFKAVITVEIPYATLSQAEALRQFIQALARAIQPVAPIDPDNIRPGSTRITLTLEKKDIARLASAFVKGKLKPLKVSSVTFGPRPMSANEEEILWLLRRLTLAAIPADSGLPALIAQRVMELLHSGRTSDIAEAVAIATAELTA